MMSAIPVLAVAILLATGPLLAPAVAQDAIADGATLFGACTACHGPGGASPGAIPSIDGLDAGALGEQLRAYRDGALEGTVMNRIARGYSDAEIAAIVAYLEAGQ